MDKYSLQKYEIYRHQMCFFKFQMHDFGRGSAPDPCGGAYDAPKLSEGGRSKANTCWIFLKIPPGISWKSAGNLRD